jgi:hypothetical protein
MERNSVSEAGLVANNLTGKRFFIQKASVQISSKDINEKFLASVKFVPPDSFNLSIRSRTGLEVARILITEDTVLVNDRLQRILYYGKPGALTRKFGISLDFIPLVFGDYIQSGSIGDKQCMNGFTEISGSLRGSKIRYLIDCRRLKNTKLVHEGSIGNLGTEVEFDDFRKIDGIFYPSSIKVKEVKTNTVITIKIEEIERPFEGNIHFIPGNRYDLIELR